MSKMPSKKRKYNARFPAGRIKKIMQTDEEIGKVAQAVPIIISRTLEMFVESLLSKALVVTSSRGAKTLTPSHVKQCILGEARFDFLRDLVKDIPDVSAAEEKELQSSESSPNSSRFTEMTVPKRISRQDSSNSCSSDTKPLSLLRTSQDLENKVKKEVTSTIVSSQAMDLTVKEPTNNAPNFYQETLDLDEHSSVITPNPTYSQPSTSNFHIPKTELVNNNSPLTPVSPVVNIDFTRSLLKPEIKVILDPPATGSVKERLKMSIQRQNSKPKIEVKKEVKVSPPQVNIDHLNSGDLQIDEDYDT